MLLRLLQDWLISRVLKANSKSFYEFFIVFMKGQTSRGPSSLITSDITPTSFLKVYWVGLKSNFVSYVSRNLSSTFLAVEGWHGVGPISASYRVSQ